MLCSLQVLLFNKAHVSDDVDNLEPKRVIQYLLNTAVTLRQQEAIMYKVTKIVNHPDYNDENPYLGNDIALWFLEEIGNVANRDAKINYPVIPDFKDEMMGGVLTAIGFGHNEFMGQTSKTLKRLETRIVPNDEATRLYDSVGISNDINESMIAVESSSNGKHKSVLPGGFVFFNSR